MTSIPSISVDQMKTIDKITVENFGLSIEMMMEHASRAIFKLASEMLGALKNKKIIILCGKGNNGGDGIGSARFFKNAGANTIVIISSSPAELSIDSKKQHDIAHNMFIPIYSTNTISTKEVQDLIQNSDLIIDALIGYNLRGNPKEPISSLIRRANESKIPILAVDIPSGLTGNKGKPSNPTIKATSTVTLGLPKKGLYKESAKKFVGELYLGDLSIPMQAYKEIGVSTNNIFHEKSLIKIHNE
ncbi:NAD(P)H-hydrate epimerase [Patescibacteria group bacterium]